MTAEPPNPAASTKPSGTTAAMPRLPRFHRDPPRPFNVRLEAEDHERLEQYTRFYNESLGADVSASDVAAQIIAQWIGRDRAFRRWRLRAREAAGGH